MAFSTTAAEANVVGDALAMLSVTTPDESISSSSSAAATASTSSAASSTLDGDLKAALRLAGRDRTMLLELEKTWRARCEVGESTWSYPPAPTHERTLATKLATHMGFIVQPQTSLDHTGGLIVARTSRQLPTRTLTSLERDEDVQGTSQPVRLLSRAAPASSTPSPASPLVNGAGGSVSPVTPSGVSTPPVATTPATLDASAAATATSTPTLTTTENAAPLRIMRRAPGSTKGSNGAAQPAKAIPSITEREKAYRAARERIFGAAAEGSVPEGAAIPTGSAGTSTPPPPAASTSASKTFRATAAPFDPAGASWAGGMRKTSRNSSNSSLNVGAPVAANAESNFSPYGTTTTAEGSRASSRASGSATEEAGVNAAGAEMHTSAGYVNPQQPQQWYAQTGTPPYFHAQQPPSWQQGNPYVTPPGGVRSGSSSHVAAAPAYGETRFDETPREVGGGGAGGVRGRAERALYDPVTGTGGVRVSTPNSTSGRDALGRSSSAAGGLRGNAGALESKERSTPSPSGSTAASRRSTAASVAPVGPAATPHPSLPARPDWVINSPGAMSPQAPGASGGSMLPPGTKMPAWAIEVTKEEKEAAARAAAATAAGAKEKEAKGESGTATASDAEVTPVAPSLAAQSSAAPSSPAAPTPSNGINGATPAAASSAAPSSTPPAAPPVAPQAQPQVQPAARASVSQPQAQQAQGLNKIPAHVFGTAARKSDAVSAAMVKELEASPSAAKPKSQPQVQVQPKQAAPAASDFPPLGGAGKSDAASAAAGTANGAAPRGAWGKAPSVAAATTTGSLAPAAAAQPAAQPAKTQEAVPQQPTTQ